MYDGDSSECNIEEYKNLNLWIAICGFHVYYTACVCVYIYIYIYIYSISIKLILFDNLMIWSILFQRISDFNSMFRNNSKVYV